MNYLLFGVLLFVAEMAHAQQVADAPFDSLGIIQKAAVPVKISTQFSFTEGPVADRKGTIYFTDQPNNKIWRYNLDGTFTEFLSAAGRANGLDMDARGNLIACADEQNELWSITPGKKVTVLLKDVGGKKLNGPNDLWLDPKGGIYFTDPYYQRKYWTRTGQEIQEQKVYYLPKGARQPVVASDELVKPNGIVGSPDGRLLFVADIKDNKTYRFSINKDGSLSDKTVFVPRGADGITLDDRGNLYLSGNGITVFDPEGNCIAHIPIPEKWTANVCFGGKNHNLLFMTAGTSIYTLQMQVKGSRKF
ncbi:SMP-30/gluconolactonase/LRE family protein [Niabella beijingensis]|uniref:SMP-30/gluconolactonase/LRE family protein n=1 Tax=Niabella beijingensis TaxID=2872700 RepID=UPI001CC1B38C|nr:SMP-30/gluconolactonase/LRE family protein [Niabella beijingensis]MBZ4190971.1 SMP-30/gluconolactonase/LRE family protein [Niabella beijingensis]